jgi:acetylornithine/N-succinyldiaminopimelate aminotransferase
MNYVMPTYGRQDIAFTHGQGVYLWDEDGRRYLDGLAGIAVNALGHGHPKLVAAIAEQAQKLIHTSNLYRVLEQEKLAQRLCELSGLQEAFFCNSGAEANEAAIKLARLFGHKQGNDLPHIIVMEKAWHGRTLGTLAATGNPKAKIGFGPLPDGFIRVPYNDLAAIEQAATDEPRVVAILLEVLQGEGGIQVADTAYLQQLRALCDQKGWLLMIDEVQSGIGRTGKWFGYQHADIQPDVICLAKGLGGGVPIGGIVAGGKAAGVMTPGTHGTTFGGGPLVCRAALTVLQTMEEDDLLAHAQAMGNYLRQSLRQALQGINGVKEIRGQGLMIGIELDRPCGEIVALALAQQLIVNVTQDTVVRLLPPLIITQDQCDDLVRILTPIITDFVQSPH